MAERLRCRARSSGAEAASCSNAALAVSRILRTVSARMPCTLRSPWAMSNTRLSAVALRQLEVARCFVALGNRALLGANCLLLGAVGQDACPGGGNREHEEKHRGRRTAAGAPAPDCGRPIT